MMMAKRRKGLKSDWAREMSHNNNSATNDDDGVKLKGLRPPPASEAREHSWWWATELQLRRERERRREESARCERREKWKAQISRALNQSVSHRSWRGNRRNGEPHRFGGVGWWGWWWWGRRAKRAGLHMKTSIVIDWLLLASSLAPLHLLNSGRPRFVHQPLIFLSHHHNPSSLSFDLMMLRLSMLTFDNDDDGFHLSDAQFPLPC